MEKSEDDVSIAQLNGLVKQRRNDEIKAILLKDASSNQINKQKSTLMHTAVMFNNIDVIAFLFTFGFNINAKNSLGQTPLLLAAQNNSYQAVQLLLALDADVLVADTNGQNALQVLFQKEKNTPVYLVGNLFERLKRSKLSHIEIVNELEKAGCSLEQVFSLNDVELTQEMLLRNKVNEEEYSTLMRRALYTKSTENAKALLEQKSGLTETRQSLIFEILINIVSNPIKISIIERSIIWTDIGFAAIDQIVEVFENESEDVVQVYLDCGIDKFYRKYHGLELLVNLFYNNQINVIEFLKNRQFDVNMRNCSQYTALHVAILCNNQEHIAYLLDHGADPNIKDGYHRYPLALAQEKKVAELLIDAGADFQFVHNNPIRDHPEDSEVRQYLIANLMIVKAQGLLRKKMREWIYGEDDDDDDDDDHFVDSKLLNTCDLYSEDLIWMKTRWFSNSFNLFSVLTEKPEHLARFIKDSNTFREVHKATKHERPLKPVYVEMLKKNLKKVRELNELRLQAATFLSNTMHIADCNHLVIRKILDFLVYKDLLVFKKIADDMFVF